MKLLPYILVLFLPSCATLSLLKEDVRSINHDARIVGRIEHAKGKTVKVFVCKGGNEGLEIVDSGTPNILGDFMFLLPGGEPYFLAAIEDKNGNNRFDDGESFSYYGNRKLEEIPAGLGVTPTPVKLSFSKTEVSHGSPLKRLKEAFRKWKPSDTKKNGSVAIACSEVISLDDPVFAPANGSQGLWAPATSVRQSGMGIYFLDEFDPAKMPVLFIHGIGGSPQDFSKLIGSLDSRKFQIWVYAYPSGLRLESAAKGAANLMDRLKEYYGFRRTHVVAHSMGGLVARRFVQMVENERSGGYISSLSTISTPWNGVSSAAIGLKRFPVPIPCWEDLNPGSAFIEQILDDPLPVPHLLVTTEKSKFSLFLPAKNDGTVSVASQLESQAVAKSSKQFVFEKSHREVLDDEEMSGALRQFLSENK